MLCPACRSPLLTFEIDDIELDYCALDLGIWFDEGEIEALFQATEPVLRATADGTRSKRRCPRCNSKMRLHYPTPQLELDLCPRGDGIWFDSGEVQQLAEAVMGDGAHPNSPQLGRVFIHLQHILGDKK